MKITVILISLLMFISSFVTAQDVVVDGNLDVTGNSNFQGPMELDRADGPALLRLRGNTPGGPDVAGLFLIDDSNNANGERWVFLMLDEDTPNRPSQFTIAYKDTGGFVSVMEMTKAGNIGMGTGQPQAKLDVNGTFLARGQADINTIVRKGDIQMGSFTN